MPSIYFNKCQIILLHSQVNDSFIKFSYLFILEVLHCPFLFFRNMYIKIRIVSVHKRFLIVTPFSVFGFLFTYIYWFTWNSLVLCVNFNSKIYFFWCSENVKLIIIIYPLHYCLLPIWVIYPSFHLIILAFLFLSIWFWLKFSTEEIY